MKKIRKGCLLLLVMAAMLLLGGCGSEQTLVRKVNEPTALDAVEELKLVALPWAGAQMLALAPDNQSGVLLADGSVQVLRDGKLTPVDIPAEAVVPGCSRRMAWSPNSRYCCYRAEDACYVIDLAQARVERMDAVLSACFNADQTTLCYARASDEGCTFYRRKVFSDTAEEALLPVGEQVQGAMYRTTKSQYLVLGENRLLCLEQVNAGQPWHKRVVADFTPSGMTACYLSYRAQTALCIVSGTTAEGEMAFSVVSPDGEDFVIDQVSCFSPVRENVVENLPADGLNVLTDKAQFPVSLRWVQLSPGGLYLLLWGEEDGQSAAYLLNLDKGGLTSVTLPESLRDAALTTVDWCAGKTLLLGDDQGSTVLCSVTGWDD
ncbi:MAG: hypothetical protein ACI4MJ_00115 [Aristaeellaceae bacterium]